MTTTHTPASLDAILGSREIPANDKPHADQAPASPPQTAEPASAAVADPPEPAQPQAQAGAQQPPQQAAAQPQDDDDPEKAAVEVAGQKMVPLSVVAATRGKAKRYTEQIAELNRTIETNNQRFEQAITASNERFDRLLATIQRGGAAQPTTGQPQSEQPKPDFYENPEQAVAAIVEAAIKQHVEPITKTIGTMSSQTSHRFAVKEHGADVVSAAFGTMKQRLEAGDGVAYQEYQRIMASGDAWGNLVNWHKEHTAKAEFGNDPAAYRQKIKDEILADLRAAGVPLPATLGQQPSAPAQVPQQQQQQPPQTAQPAAPAAVTLPTNLTQGRNAGPRSGPAWSGPTPITDIFNRSPRKAARG